MLNYIPHEMVLLAHSVEFERCLLQQYLKQIVKQIVTFAILFDAEIGTFAPRGNYNTL